MTSVSLLFLSLISQCRDFWLKNHPVEVQCYGRGAVVTLVLKLRISDAVGGLNACRRHGVQGTRVQGTWGAGDTGCGVSAIPGLSCAVTPRRPQSQRPPQWHSLSFHFLGTNYSGIV